MPDNTTAAAPASDLLPSLEARARQLVADNPASSATPSPEATRQALHELRVHQIELEMQNEELRRTQAEMDAIRARYFDLYDLAPVGYLTINEQGLIMEANLAAASMLDVARSALIKQPISRFICHEDQDIYYLHRKKLLNTGNPQSCELRMVKAERPSFWTHLSATVARNSDGTTDCLIIMIDINERKRYQVEIERNEARLQRLVAILQHPAKSIQEFLDYALEQAIHLTGSKIGYIFHYHEERQEFVLNSRSKEVMAACAIADPPSCYELEKTGIWGEAVRQRRPIIVNDFAAAHPLKKGYPEGHIQLVRFITVPIFKGDRIVGVIGLANRASDYDENDILQISQLLEAVWSVVERKQAEEDVLKSAREWFAAMDSSMDIIYLLDLKRRIIRANKSFFQATGTTPATAIGRHIVEIVHPLGEELPCPVCLAQQELRDLRMIMEADHPDNPLARPLEVSVQIVRDMEERPLSILMTLHDLTVSRQAMAEKETMAHQLLQAQKMESVGRLAGGVAHDFNNMLSVIIGHAELALGQLKPDQPLHTSLMEIFKAARRSADLTRQLLAFARKQTVTPKVVDLNETLTSLLKMLQRLIGEAIALHWQPGKELWPVKIDPSQFDQIMTNLVLNARDAITDVGMINIETSNHTIDTAYCTAHPEFVPGEYVRLVISDNGSGMDQVTMAHIFEPFFTTKTMGKGTGLGLATVYGAVRQNNGFIDIHSVPGQGTTFTIYLPRHGTPGAQPSAQDTQSTIVPTLTGQGTILLVEDEAAILEVATRQLAGLGYTTLAATTPAEALRLARENNGTIDLLITDVIMPEMNGRDLAKNLQLLYPKLKVLFISGYTADIIAAHGVLDENVHFLQKPFYKSDLATKIREALERQ